MQSKLQGIANRARESKEYRFRNLYTMIDRLFLEDSWEMLNRKAAPGLDGQTVEDYEKQLPENLDVLVKQLKRKGYRAKQIKRVNIPKDNGKSRPLGLPVIEDKLLQTAAARILNAIYEEDFLSCSYGYRPNVGPHEAAGNLRETIQTGSYGYVVEVDIKGFFDNIDHEWLIKFLELRIDDKAFIGLIRKWLKASVLEEDGSVIHTETGTPQGGVISPVLANIYLHYVIDLWFEKIVKSHCKGAAYMVRFADDFVCVFQFKKDAERFYEVLPKRLAKFGLECAPDKTKIIRFSRFGIQRNEAFDFLGFEYRWVKSRKGKSIVKRRTSRKKFRIALKNVTEWCRNNRHLKIKYLMPKFNDVLRGHFDYYGVPLNSEDIKVFRYKARRILFKWLNRRSQRRSYSWEGFDRMEKYYPLTPARIRNKPVQLFLAFS